jgi:hypothetical protein
VTTAKILVVFNVIIIMALASAFTASHAFGWKTADSFVFDVLAFIVGWAALLGVPIAAIWGLGTWKHARFWPGLVVHPIALVLWVSFTLGFGRAR